MLPRNLTIVCVALVVSTACHLLHQRTKTAMMVGEAMEMIDRFYVEPVDSRALMISAMAGMTSNLDQHSEYIPPRDYETFQDSINQEFAGIGIYVDQPVVGEPVRVITPLVRSPAMRAGVLPNDQILAVDGEDVSLMEIREVSSRLRGPVGTKVSLTLKRDEEEIQTEVQRAQIEIESVIGDHRDADSEWVYRLEPQPNVAYIKMTSFGDKTVEELRLVLNKLNNDFDAIVLDLRGNGGGLLTAAVEVSDMFLNRGKIVSTKTRGGVLEEQAEATEGTLVDPSKPMAILIDQDSASASEIVAAALQDAGRAIVGGARSFGKGTVQNILPLEYGRSALRLTVAKYYRPSDQNIHRGKDDDEDDVWGVTPDEGLAVDMDLPRLRRLMILRQEASFPSLIGIDRSALTRDEGSEPTPSAAMESEPTPAPEVEASTTDKTSNEADTIPEDATIWQLDEPLNRVVERMLLAPSAA